MNMSDKEMADFLQKLRNRNEMPINEEEYYLIGEIAERLIELSELKGQEGYVSVPFSWLVKFCTHIEFEEPMSDAEREKMWKQKLKQQFNIDDDNRCWLYSGCPCRTGGCYGLPDDGCPVYRRFRKLIEEREKNIDD